MKSFLLTTIVLLSSLSLQAFPSHWWEKVPEDQRKDSWEILPQEAGPGELVLSKRNELGQFSNLAATAFEFQGERFASVEALWQMMKYPEEGNIKDHRVKHFSEYPYSRNQVKQLSGFTAKKAGDKANAINQKYFSDKKNLSYRSFFFDYKDMAEGSKFHYQIISAAIKEKVLQIPKLLDLLLSTKDLILVPDHKMGKNRPRSYYYNQILMDIRSSYQLKEK